MSSFLKKFVIAFCVLAGFFFFAEKFNNAKANWSLPVNNTVQNKEHAVKPDDGVNKDETNAGKNHSNTDLSSLGTNEPKTPTELSEEKESILEQMDLDNFFKNPLISAMSAVIIILCAVIIFLIVKNRKITKSSGGNKLKFDKNPAVKNFFRVGNLHHIGCREEQQDSFCISNIEDEQAMRDKGIMAVVADGMGGLEGGAAISQLVVDTFSKSYAQISKIDNPENFLYNTANDAENLVDTLKKQTGINGGSTIVAAIIKNGELNILSVGDSRIYLLRQGNLQQINHEHTFGAFLQEKAERGEISPEEPFINPKRNALTAYIGMGSLKKVDRQTSIPLYSGDKILICSDGVFNALESEAMIVALTGEAVQAAEKLERMILAQRIPTQDNFTGIILECVDAE